MASPCCRRALLGLWAAAAASAFASAAPATQLAASLVAPEVLPEIHHYKEPGAGYTEASPLYQKQLATRDLAAAASTLSPSRVAGLINPVSTSMACIINLVTQYFFVHAMLFVVRALNHFGVIDKKPLQKGLVTVAETVFFAPMLCVLFLAVRMRAVQLSGGRTMKHDLPQWWVKDSMVACSWSTLLLSVLVFACALLYGDTWEAAAKNRGLGISGQVLVGCRSIVLSVIYVGFTLVCIGTLSMPPPEEIWGELGPPSSPTTACTVFLAVIYFTIYLALAVARLSNEAGVFAPPQRFNPTQELLKTASMTVAFSPMLCALFIAARLRATELGWQRGEPQEWVQQAVFTCTASVFAQTLLAVLGATMGVQDIIVQEGGHTDLVEDRGMPPDSLSSKARVVEAVRLAFMVCLYVGAAAVVAGICFMKAPPPLPGRATFIVGQAFPSALRCVIVLAMVYFTVYLAWWIVLTMRRQLGPPIFGKEFDFLVAARNFLETEAKDAVTVCPMLSILFLCTLMRALQIAGGSGVPPKWCQDIVVLATACMVFLAPARMDMLLAKPPPMLSKACSSLQYVCLGLLYAFAGAATVGLFTMVPSQDTVSLSAVANQERAFLWSM